jgi:hypothetical protein
LQGCKASAWALLLRRTACARLAPAVAPCSMENKTALTCCAVSFAAGVCLGFSINRALRKMLKRLDKDL